MIHIFKTKEEAGEEYPEAGEDTEAENDAEAEKDAETKAHTEETKDVSEKQQNTDGKTI